MLKMSVQDLDSGLSQDYFGTEHQLEKQLHREFLGTVTLAMDLEEMVQAVNSLPYKHVEVGPVQPKSNLLPEGFATLDSDEDPWPRESD